MAKWWCSRWGGNRGCSPLGAEQAGDPLTDHVLPLSSLQSQPQMEFPLPEVQMTQPERPGPGASPRAPQPHAGAGGHRAVGEVVGSFRALLAPIRFLQSETNHPLLGSDPLPTPCTRAGGRGRSETVLGTLCKEPPGASVPPQQRVLGGRGTHPAPLHPNVQRVPGLSITLLPARPSAEGGEAPPREGAAGQSQARGRAAAGARLSGLHGQVGAAGLRGARGGGLRGAGRPPPIARALP